MKQKKKKRMQRKFWSNTRPIDRRSIHPGKIHRMYETKGAIAMNSPRRIDRSFMKEQRTSAFIIVRWRGDATLNRTQAHRSNGDGQMIVPTSYASATMTAFSHRVAHSLFSNLKGVNQANIDVFHKNE